MVQPLAQLEVSLAVVDKAGRWLAIAAGPVHRGLQKSTFSPPFASLPLHFSDIPLPFQCVSFHFHCTIMRKPKPQGVSIAVEINNAA